jgi:hypothetical protein
MDKDLVAILITNEAGGRLFYLSPGEWARLERDYAGYRANNHPTGGTYRHRVPAARADTTRRARLRRMLSGERGEAGVLALEFAGTSIISGQ